MEYEFSMKPKLKCCKMQLGAKKCEINMTVKFLSIYIFNEGHLDLLLRKLLTWHSKPIALIV